MKCIFIILLLTFITVKAESQTKTILGDTAYWYNRYTVPLLIQTESPIFLDSKNDFNFRLQYYGQIIDIWKNDNQIGGTLTNYIYKLGKRGRTISTKSILNDSVAEQTYQLIYDSGLLNLKSDKEIEGWEQGTDGMTYIIEHSDKNNYWYKTYWTPYIQDSIKEAVIINNFIVDVSSILSLKESYKRFKEKVPRNGCYGNGGMTVTCYQSNNYEVGYSGSAKLPLGYILGLDVGYIGKLKTDFGLSIIHQMDIHGNYDLSTSVGKSNLFIRNKRGINDFALYTYRYRKSDRIEDGTKYQNHKVLYGLNLRSTSLAIGVDVLDTEKSRMGGFFLVNQYIPKPRLGLTSQTSIFENQLDYKIGISKYININTFRNISVGLYYERFAKHGNLGWSLSTNL